MRIKRILWLLPVMAGVAAVIFAAKLREDPPSVVLDGEISVPVRVAKVRRYDGTPWISGYGVVSPSRVWHGVADVSGRVSYVNPRLKEGELVSEGEVMVKVDDQVYQLAVDQQESALNQAKWELQSLTVQERHERESLAIAKKSLALYQKDLERYRGLLKKGSTSPSEVDRLERLYLGERQKVQTLESALALMPSRVESLKAKMASLEAVLSKAKLDLAHCVISAPFDGRVAGVAVEGSQFVPQGRELLRVEDVASLEIPVKIGLDRMEVLGLSDKGTVEADVIFQGGDGSFNWKGHLDRGSHAVDPLTRTIGLIVRVENVTSKEGLELVPGITCNVRIFCPSTSEVMAIPKESVRDGIVYVVDSNSRLEYREVRMHRAEGEGALVISGLSEGETVVISELEAPVPGMKLKPFDLEEERR